MSKSKIFIAVIAVLVVIFLLYAFRTSKSPGSNSAGQNSSAVLTQGNLYNPSTTAGTGPNTNPTPQTDKLTFQTTAGDVQMENFFLYPKSTQNEYDEIITFAKNNDFHVFYNFDGNYFEIDILNLKTKSTARENAEFALMNVLGINETDACKLPIDVLLQNPYTQQTDSVNYGLSFCPGSLLLFDE